MQKKIKKQITNKMIDLRKNKNAYRFNKEDGKWYIDLPDWTGTKGELQMVGGADTLLDVLDTNNNNKVYVEVDTEIFNNFDIFAYKLGLRKSYGKFTLVIQTLEPVTDGEDVTIKVLEETAALATEIEKQKKIIYFS